MLGITQSQQMEKKSQGITLGIIFWQKINSNFKIKPNTFAWYGYTNSVLRFILTQ
jgi:hypothetical protein